MLLQLNLAVYPPNLAWVSKPNMARNVNYYCCITRRLGAMTVISCLQPPRPVLSSTSLFDHKDTAEEWAARPPANCSVGGGSNAMEGINHGMASPQSHEGTLMQGSFRIVLGNVVAYTNGKQGKD